jgi:hypothetical protein
MKMFRLRPAAAILFSLFPAWAALSLPPLRVAPEYWQRHRRNLLRPGDERQPPSPPPRLPSRPRRPFSLRAPEKDRSLTLVPPADEPPV